MLVCYPNRLTPRRNARARAFDSEVRPFNNRLVLFGAGNTGRQVLARLRQDGIEPLAFSDNQSTNWGKTLDGLIVLPPNEAIANYGTSAAFIVTIYNNRHSFPESRDRLLRLGCTKVVSVIPVRWKYHETFLPHYRDDLPYKVLMQRDAIRDAFDLWADERSQREYVGQIEWRLHGNFDVLGIPDPESEYFPKDIMQIRGADEVFVDVGAYDGDTIQRFINVVNGALPSHGSAGTGAAELRRLADYLLTIPEASQAR